MVLDAKSPLAVKAENLSIGYEDLDIVTWAVKNVRLELAKGGSLCLVGESGSGKTTLGNAIAGLIPPYTRVAGSLFVEGIDVIRDSRVIGANKIRGKVAVKIPQNPAMSLNPYVNIEQMFYDVLREVRGIKNKGVMKEEALKLVSMVGLQEDVLYMYPHELSGGMSQRVTIALALASKPSLVVADEPTSNLDAYLRGYIVKLIKDLSNKFGMSLVVITHDISITEVICEDMVVMLLGELVEHGRVADIIRNPLHPYTSELIEATSLQRASRKLRENTGGCVYYSRCPYAHNRCLEAPSLLRTDNGREVRCWRQAQ